MFRLSIFVATDIYAFFTMSVKKISTKMFKTKRGGKVNRFLHKVKKTAELVGDGIPIPNQHTSVAFVFHESFI